MICQIPSSPMCRFVCVQIENILHDSVHDTYILCDYGNCSLKSMHPEVWCVGGCVYDTGIRIKSSFETIRFFFVNWTFFSELIVFKNTH